MLHTINRLKIAVLILSVVTFASGQLLTGYGPKGGLNLANVSGDDNKDAKMKIGAAVGGFATLDFDLPVTLQLEGLYSMKGWKVDESETFGGETYTSEGTVGINYLEINILAVYPINDQISVFAGPALGLFLGGKTEVTTKGGGESETYKEDVESDDMNGMDFGLTIGGGYNLGIVTVEARYSLGLKEAYKDADMKNNVIQIMVSYSL